MPFLLTLNIKKRILKLMKENLEKIAVQYLHLSGAKKDRFVREAEALRSNLVLRKKQLAERGKGNVCLKNKGK